MRPTADPNGKTEPAKAGAWPSALRRLLKPGNLTAGAVALAASAVVWNPLPLILWGLGSSAWAVGGAKEGKDAEAAALAARQALSDGPSYLAMAFKHPANLSALGAAVAVAGLTANPVVALGALVAEGVWLILAPESKRLRHILWDPRFDELRRELEARERAERTKDLSVEQRQRVDDLVSRQDEIRRLAARNPSFTGDLLRGELVKTDRLVSAFVDMSLTTARYKEYLASIDLDELERERRRHEGLARKGDAGDPEAEVARKNLAILLKRLDKMKEIRRYLNLAQGQLDLIENSFQLIQDQIVTMQSPQQLSGQLDELLDGVEAIRETSRDTEAILGSLPFERVSAGRQ